MEPITKRAPLPPSSSPTSSFLELFPCGCLSPLADGCLILWEGGSPGARQRPVGKGHAHSAAWQGCVLTLRSPLPSPFPILQMQQPWQKCAKGKPGQLPGIAVAGPHAHLTHLLLSFPSPLFCLPPLSLGREGSGPTHPIKPMSVLQEVRVPPC